MADGMVAATELVDALQSMAELPYGREPVDQLIHSLQCAGHALDAGADDELIVASLYHDIGRAPAVSRVSGAAPHEAVGARWCRRRLGERVAWLVGAHVAAKRYLVATEPDYLDQLSPGSVQSLEVQGGRLPADEVDAWAAHPWSADACRLRRWDELAKEPDAPVPDFDQVIAVATRVAARAGRQ